MYKYFLVLTGAFVDAGCPICLLIAASKILRSIFFGEETQSGLFCNMSQLMIFIIAVFRSSNVAN